MFGGDVLGIVYSNVAFNDIFLFSLDTLQHNLLIVVIDHGHLIRYASADEVGHWFNPRRARFFFAFLIFKDQRHRLFFKFLALVRTVLSLFILLPLLGPWTGHHELLNLESCWIFVLDLVDCQLCRLIF